MKICGQSARFKTGLLRWALPLLLAFPGTLCTAAAEPQPPAAPAPWRVVITGFVRPAGTFVQPIPGAQTTAFAAAITPKSGAAIQCLSREEFTALGVEWEAFRAGSIAAASAELARITPEWIRDRNHVIECAILRARSPSGDVTAAILAPDFLQRFTPVFGRKMLLAIPERRTVYLFPRLASRYQDYGSRILAIYQKSECPVSREVFELSAAGLRAIGEYEEP